MRNPLKNPLLTLALLAAMTVFAQDNLVRNPSFELYNHLPAYIGDAPGSIRDWSFANENGSGDYFHEKAIGTKCRTENNYFGSEKPHSGVAYAGFCVTPVYREFLCSQLIKPLEKGKQYKFTMYISKGDDKELSPLKEISVMFLSRQWPIRFGLQMSLPPQIIFYQDTGFTQSNGWQELTILYTATGHEKWIYIGSHEWKCDTCTVPGKARTENPDIFIPSSKKESHYYVDDVSITEVAGSNVPDDSISFEIGQHYSFNNIQFATNSAVLEQEDQPALEKVLAFMKANPEVNVSIAGYTDNVGSEENNLKLSLARAQAVKSWLVENGIDPGRIYTDGFGEFHPVGDNNTEEGRALNRRVDFLFEKK